MTAALLLAAVTFGAPFSDGCVLQRGRPVPVWGLASPGEEVKVVFADKSAVTHAGADGAWRVDLPALEASAEGRELKANGAIVRDVLVGEVWIASGQSNMAFPLRAGNPRGTDRGGALAAGMTRIPALRYASVPSRRADRPRRDGRIVWHAAVPEELEKHAFSAVGFYFARELAQSLGVPVGVIGASVGATSIDSWIPAERFSFGRSPRAGNDPSVYYNGMVAQIVPYASKGFVWYQGERNSDAREWPLYAAKLSVFFASWKEAFENEDLRIRLVQLAPWGRETLPYVQEAQSVFTAGEPAAKMAIVNDLGNLSDIHPNDKEPVGRRLAALALKHDYGFDIAADSPEIASWRVDGSNAVLSVAGARRLYVYHPDWPYRGGPAGTEALGFELAGADGVWHPARIENLVRTVTGRDARTGREYGEYRGEIRGTEIVLSSGKVAAPVSVRYLFRRPWRGSVYNESALALASFRRAFPSSGTVVFPKGEYRFDASTAARMPFFISNHDQSPAHPVMFPVVGATNLVIRGEGARFVIDGEAIAFLLKDCSGVKIEGIELDWKHPFCREAEITAFENGSTRFRMIDPYRPQGSCIVRMFRRDKRWMVPGAGDIRLKFEPEDLGGGEMRLKHDFSRDGAGARVGDILAFRPFGRPSPAVVIYRSRDTSLNDFTVRTAHGMGLLAQRSENVVWKGGGVIPRPGRYSSTQADATHFSNVKGLVHIENCRFEGMMDDAINVHSTCLAVRGVPDSRTIRCRFMHEQAYGFEVFRPGETVRFIRAATLEPVGEATVTSVTRESDRDVVLGLSAAVPPGFGVGDAVENADWQCAAVFRGNVVANNRARSALFTTPKKVLVENNVFDRSTSSSLLFSGDACSWYETGFCSDVTISGNLFRNCMAAASRNGLSKGIICFNPEVSDVAAQKRRCHANVVIENNRFETFRVPLLYAVSVSNLCWRGNEVVYNDSCPPWPDTRPFVVNGCDAVDIRSRVVTDLSGAGWTLTESDGRSYAVTVPHCWNIEDACDGKEVLSSERYAKNSSCINSYERKRVVYSRPLPPAKPGRRYFIRCHGASITASLAVDGRTLGSHIGAFTAFCFEITGALAKDRESLLEIAVDNFSRDDIAPPVNADFNMHGGLYRGVELIETPPVCIDPVTDGASGVRLVADPDTGKVRAEINVLGGPDEVREFAVKDFKLWSPETPVVYTQRFEIASGDAVVETFGFRKAEFRPDGFYLNGKKRFIRGVNYHQDREGKGWAISEDDIRGDIDAIKKLGADGLRTAHYPHSGFTYSQCDERGLVVWCEQPNVNGLRFNDAFRSNCWGQTREMVAQLGNHPSIICWSIFNELYNKVPMREGEPEAMMEQLRDDVKKWDPSRPVAAAGSFPDKLRLNRVSEVLGFNRYPGWYGFTPDYMAEMIDEICRKSSRGSFGMTEFGAGGSVNQHGDAKEPCEAESSWHTEEYQAYVHTGHYRSIVSDPRVWGAFVWCMFDFGSDRRLEGEKWGRNDKGLVTYDRLEKKDSWYFYHANWSDGKTLRLVGSRRPNGTTNETLTVLGFSNAGDVKLSVNGRLIGVKTPDKVRSVIWENVPMEIGTNIVTLVSGGLEASGIWRRVPACNFDESKIGEVELEDPLRFADGRKVETENDWRSRRREILGIFEREMYGTIPPPVKPRIEVIDRGISAGGFAERKLVRMRFRDDGSGPCINWLILTPRFAKGRSPAVMFLNYGGNHELISDTQIPVPKCWMRPSPEFSRYGERASAATRGLYADHNLRTVYPVGMILARGFAVVTACYGEISPDWHGRVLDGRYREDDVLSLFPYDAKRQDNPTALGAWAWALMRGMDMLEEEPAIDAKRVTVAGSSRLGKAALIAGAFDERFYAVVPNQTGGGGVPLLKRNYGENAESLYRNFPHWFSGEFAKYVNNEKSMKFDSHLLLACVAPRKLLVEGFDNPFYDAKGEFEALKAADPVWKFLGKKPLSTDVFPEPYDTSAVGDDIGYVRRTERHGFSAHDWTWLMDFVSPLRELTKE